LVLRVIFKKKIRITPDIKKYGKERKNCKKYIFEIKLKNIY
jgi:hypothetical protein